MSRSSTVRTPVGTVALKRFRIGEGMDVEVAVNLKVNAEVGKNGMVFHWDGRKNKK